jgi:iron-sulfur cluster assembly protein
MKVDIDFRVESAAVVELKRLLDSSGGSEAFVRVLSKGGGCSSRSFGLALIPEGDVNPGVDLVEDFDGLKLVVDKKCLLMLDGAAIEFSDSHGGFGFRFASPKSSCGCKKGGSCKKEQ